MTDSSIMVQNRTEIKKFQDTSYRLQVIFIFGTPKKILTPNLLTLKVPYLPFPEPVPCNLQPVTPYLCAMLKETLINATEAGAKVMQHYFNSKNLLKIC
jgi:hypothetical protein